MIGAGIRTLFWLLLMLPFHLLARRRGASDWPRRFLARVARIVGLEVRCAGALVPGGSLLIANHVSWLDVIALGSVTNARFVAKAELGRGLAGRFVALHDTLLVDRADRRGARAQADALQGHVGARDPVALFPEGTTGDGSALLPFRATLLAAVSPPPPGVAVQPVALDYGPDIADFAWVGGEPFLANLRRVLARGRTAVTVRIGPPLPPEALRHRRDTSAAARAWIAEALRLPRDGAA